MSIFVENFSSKLPISWHPGDVQLTAVCAGNQAANQYRSLYRESDLSLEEIADALLYNAWAPIRWRYGKCASANFIDSAFMVLDFDEADYTLSQARADWSDSIHIIGTTKSHRVEKDGKPAKDRFRVIVPWEKRITARHVYSHNLEKLIRKYDADNTCSDAARFFWPCREIVSINTSGYLQPVLAYKEPDRLSVNRERLAALRQDLFGNDVPVWVARFIRDGKMPDFEKLNGSRKWVCFAVASKLRKLGWHQENVAHYLHQGKFDRTGFEPKEIDAAIKSAFKRS